MPIQQETKQIDGVGYRVTKFGAVKAFEVVARVGIGVGFRDLKPEDLMWLRGELAQVSEVGIVDTAGDGRTTWVAMPQCFDEHFRGKTGAMMKWLAFAFESQFGPLGDMLPGLIRGLKELSPSGFLKAATGGSGGSSPPKG